MIKRLLNMIYFNKDKNIDYRDLELAKLIVDADENSFKFKYEFCIGGYLKRTDLQNTIPIK